RLVRFSEDSGRFVRGAVAELVKKGARGLLFDLRDNGGGLLSEAVQVADVFIEPGDGSKVIVYSKGRQGVTPTSNHFSTKRDELGGVPLVVLVNTGSASASEIVAGALQDWRRARIVGTRTFGKGSVQSLIPMRSTGMKTKLKLTIARYHLPSGRPIDKKHPVDPDVKARGDVLAGWESEEIARLGLRGKIDEHVRKAYRDAPVLFEKLAESDAGKLEAYPGLRELVESFGTRVSDDALRGIARESARLLVADDRGREFVVDLQEDRVLRRGVYEILARMDNLAEQPLACRRIIDEFGPLERRGAAAPPPADAPAPPAPDEPVPYE
ncbi:MAG: S41 family peptidase, partial [Planctomycetota bacterium]